MARGECGTCLAVARREKARALARVNLHVLPAGPIQTNAYLLTAPERGEAVLIDAPGEVWAEVAPILEAEKCKLTELWLTHGHWDHMQGGAEVVRATGAKVLAQIGDREMIETPEIMELRANNLRMAYKYARQLIREVSEQAKRRHGP